MAWPAWWAIQQRLADKIGVRADLSMLIVFKVALVRMCADGAKPPAKRFGYNNAFDALIRIGREEGLRTFTRGLGPNVVRSVIMSKGSESLVPIDD